MKGMDIFCASQTAISCLSMDEPSSSTIHLGGSGRAIDRYNPIIRDPKRFGSSRTTLPNLIPASCSSQPPISPKPLSQSHHPKSNHHQSKNHVTVAKNSSKPSNEKSYNSNTNKKKIKINNKSSPAIQPPPLSDHQEKRKSSSSIATSAAEVHDQPNDFRSSTSAFTSGFAHRKSWSCSSKAAAGDFISPPGSSRYLMGTDQAAFFELISEDLDPLVKLLPPVVEAEPPHNSLSNCNSNNNKAMQKDDQSICAFTKPVSSSSSGSQDQVVVLRVSLHCRGCERKMRKHISRMEGVSSFNIDFAAKKVTVVGNVTPLGVLASISKVKNAQLWTPAVAAAAAVSSSSHANPSEINKNR